MDALIWGGTLGVVWAPGQFRNPWKNWAFCLPSTHSRKWRQAHLENHSGKNPEIASQGPSSSALNFSSTLAYDLWTGLVLEAGRRPGTVAQHSNCSYLGGSDQEEQGSRQKVHETPSQLMAGCSDTPSHIGSPNRRIGHHASLRTNSENL
jgi:hypothetical protein